MDVFERYAAPHFTTKSRVLEISPSFEYRPTGSTALWHTTGLNGDPRLTMQCSEYCIPVPAETYDIVYSANVIEHVREPWTWLRELTRVCVRGGLVITICPANWPYHEDPIDCWRIYPEGMSALMLAVGLEVVTCLALYGEPHGESEHTWFPNGGIVIDTIGVGRKC